jgi:hypothetical protein
MLRRDVLVGALILVVAGGRPPGRRIRPRPRSPSSMSASGDPGGSDDYDEADLGWADRAVAPGRIGGSGGAGLRRGEPRVLLPDRHPATRHRARTRVQARAKQEPRGTRERALGGRRMAGASPLADRTRSALRHQLSERRRDDRGTRRPRDREQTPPVPLGGGPDPCLRRLRHHRPERIRAKGLGGELALEPFATAAIALGPFDLIGEVSYTWTFKPEHAQAFDSGLAAAWPVSDGSPRSSSSAQPRPPSPRTTGPRSPSSPA